MVWRGKPPPARVVATTSRRNARGDLDAVIGLAAKYDLVVFDPRAPRINRPLDMMAEHATATFWPRGGIQAFVAGAVGLGIAVLGWYLGIPVLSWIAMPVTAGDGQPRSPARARARSCRLPGPGGTADG